jgi:hypothetical protein
LDDVAALGSAGDIWLGPWENVYVGVGQDIVFRRSDEGLTLRKANSTGFFVWAHMGIGTPMPELFIQLAADTTTTTAGG